MTKREVVDMALRGEAPPYVPWSFALTEEAADTLRNALGRLGNYIFSPAHAVEGDVPAENMLAFIEEAKAQPGTA